MKAVAIVTARGGSKRIPRKNIRDFCGKPILAYSIQAALDCGEYAEVMVSTDDPEIATLATQLGAKVPFLRSANTSSDFATTADVISEVLMEYHLRRTSFDVFTCIYPTAPFVTGVKLSQSLALLRDHADAETVVPVVAFSFPIQRALQIQDGLLSMVHPEHLSTRSQDLPPRYHDCGQFYTGRSVPFLGHRKLFGPKTLPIVIPATEAQDIDHEEDWQIAEMKFLRMTKAKDR